MNVVTMCVCKFERARRTKLTEPYPAQSLIARTVVYATVGWPANYVTRGDCQQSESTGPSLTI